MAHYAEIDDNNIVQRVIVIPNEKLLADGLEIEAKGMNFCNLLYQTNTTWIRTSYNGTFRKRFAGIGFKYMPEYDAFVPPMPIPVLPSEQITFDEENLTWITNRNIPQKI